MKNRIDDFDCIVEIGMILAVIVVVILKLTGIITLSWLWLSAIIWVPALAGMALMFMVLVVMITRGIIELIKENKNERYKNV